MLERIHQHLLSELERITRADTIFVVCAVLFNLLALFISWTQVPTGSGIYRSGSFGIYILTTMCIAVVSGAALKALQSGQRAYEELNAALIKIYGDVGVENCFAAGMSARGARRLTLPFVLVAGTSLIAVGIPILQYLKV